MEHPNGTMAWLATPDDRVVIGHGPFTESDEPPAEGVAFHVQDFALTDPRPWKIPASIVRTNRLDAVGELSESPHPVVEWQAPDAAPFSVIFQEVMAAIHSGVFEKTVPVVTETGTAEFSPQAMITAAMLKQGAPLHSYGWIQHGRGFAGATPECLFSLDGKQLTTMALAGTARSDDRVAFAADEKEIREHEYVAQTLVSKLQDLGIIERSERAILDLGSIVHFLTHIRVALHEPGIASQLVRRLHPTPALGPHPRTGETLAQLIRWRDRSACPSAFGAPFGLWDHGKFRAVVAIRGIWWQENRLSLPAGCGVIEASRLVSEWRELRLKREAVKRFLPQA
ncbi:MAG: chorismate-binding protein [Verrucomicrobiota bacterium]